MSNSWQYLVDIFWKSQTNHQLPPEFQELLQQQKLHPKQPQPGGQCQGLPQLNQQQNHNQQLQEGESTETSNNIFLPTFSTLLLGNLTPSTTLNLPVQNLEMPEQNVTTDNSQQLPTNIIEEQSSLNISDISAADFQVNNLLASCNNAGKFYIKYKSFQFLA